MLINTFLISLTFVPFHVMRLRNEAATYSALVFARSAGTVAAQILLVIGLGWGLTGWFAADLIVTLAVDAGVVAMVCASCPMDVLARRARGRAAIRPAAAAARPGAAGPRRGKQASALSASSPSTRWACTRTASRIGTGVRFFTSAFETAWAPFYYATAKQADAQVVFAKVATYGVAALTVHRCGHGGGVARCDSVDADAGISGRRARDPPHRRGHGHAGRLPAHVDRTESDQTHRAATRSQRLPRSRSGWEAVLC